MEANRNSGQFVGMVVKFPHLHFFFFLFVVSEGERGSMFGFAPFLRLLSPSHLLVSSTCVVRSGRLVAACTLVGTVHGTPPIRHFTR